MTPIAKFIEELQSDRKVQAARKSDPKIAPNWSQTLMLLHLIDIATEPADVALREQMNEVLEREASIPEKAVKLLPLLLNYAPIEHLNRA